MKLAVVGSRTIDDYEFVEQAIMESPFWSETERLISGGEPDGVDNQAEEFAERHGLPIDVISPHDGEFDHLKFEKATLARNEKIVGHADAMVAVKVIRSAGTGHAIDKAMEMGVDLYVKHYAEEPLLE